MNPISQAIDRAMRCVKCNTLMSVGCHCWDEKRLERLLVDEIVKAVSDTETFEGLLTELERIVVTYKSK